MIKSILFTKGRQAGFGGPSPARLLMGRLPGMVRLMLNLAVLGCGLGITGCGGSSNAIPPIVLTVSLGNNSIVLEQGTVDLVPVTIVAPTETATFSITGLPAGVSEVYKESESNPSGQLTLTANATAPVGTYMPKITVGSSGQTASLVFTLTISAAK